MDLDELKTELSQNAAYWRAYAEEDLLHRVAERVYMLRKKMGITQEELAYLVKTKQPAIAEIEGGFVNLTLRRMARLASALGCRPEDLVTREDPAVLSGGAGVAPANRRHGNA